MRLSAIDITIILLYLLSTIFIGLWYRKKARQNKESYMLGGRSLPWYKLGLSDASDMFDISGTMWMVSLCFVYGTKSRQAAGLRNEYTRGRAAFVAIGGDFKQDN